MNFKIIGLTGPSGSGKTTVCQVARVLNIAVLNADLIAREVTVTGSPVLPQLQMFFGKEILQSDGSLDRHVLAQRAFVSREHTETLNNIIFPFITERVLFYIEKFKKSGNKALILDAPTLFESGCDSLCDCVIAVLSNEALRRERIVSRDNLDEKAANLRLSACQDDDFFKSRTDLIIFNNGSIPELTNSAINTLKNILDK
ncbi:MAG: dephospho-CoA kinase [Oscillospiraceae bacterium]